MADASEERGRVNATPKKMERNIEAFRIPPVNGSKGMEALDRS